MDGLAIAASLGELRAAIEGGRVRGVYRPSRGVFRLDVFGDGDRSVLIAPEHAAIHLTELDLPNPPRPGPFVMLLRRHLCGGTIVALHQRGWDRVVTVEVERRDGRTAHRYELVAELIGPRGNLLLLDGGKVLGAGRSDARNRPGRAYEPIPAQEKADPAAVTVSSLEAVLDAERPDRSLCLTIDGIGRHTARDLIGGLPSAPRRRQRAEALRARLTELLGWVEAPSPRVVTEEGRASFYPLPPPAQPAPTLGRALDAVSPVVGTERSSARPPVRPRLEQSIERRRRTVEKLQAWLDDADEEKRLQRTADLLMIHHAQIEPGAGEVVLRDPATGRQETVSLLPTLTPIENAQRRYERAKRLRRGRPQVISRKQRLERELELLRRALADVEAGREIDERAAALLPEQGDRSPPVRQGHGRRIEVEGLTVLVGRSAADNDRLLREASSTDLWLHAKGVAGSHVIVRRGGRREIPPSVVHEAARLAAAHSRARSERRVEVLVAEARHVRKPKGAAPGLVNVAVSDTLTVDL